MNGRADGGGAGGGDRGKGGDVKVGLGVVDGGTVSRLSTKVGEGGRVGWRKDSCGRRGKVMPAPPLSRGPSGRCGYRGVLNPPPPPPPLGLLGEKGPCEEMLSVKD